MYRCRGCVYFFSFQINKMLGWLKTEALYVKIKLKYMSSILLLGYV